jgi:DNA-3-methyladenine glycosylase I
MAEDSRMFRGEDGLARCSWCQATPEYRAYHDGEWGFPVTEDRRLFEKICLEGFQSGLSWLTILRKRQNFRAAFANFEIAKVASFGDSDVERLLQDAGIIRHRGKIVSAINNARRAADLAAEKGSLRNYFWGFEPSPASRPAKIDAAAYAALTTSPESVAMSKDLKKRGFTFVGPTTAYAFMQAMGLVNDHLEGCHVRPAALEARRALVLS